MLLIAEAFEKTLCDAGLTSMRAAMHLFLGNKAPGPAVLVKEVRLPGAVSAAFYKHYEYPAGSWEFFARKSKARCEFENYDVFKRLELPAAERVACGEERDTLGRLRRAFIITKAIPDAQTLVEFLRSENFAPTAARIRRRKLITKLAQIASGLHAAGFFYRDFVLRNILVTDSRSDDPRIWLIDCPRGKFHHLFTLRWRVKDLASLDKAGSKLCTRGERLLFLKTYLQKPCVDEQLKTLAARTLAYRKRRWPEDWQG